MKSLRPTKTCTRCGYTGDRFKGPNRSTSDGYDHICMDCVLDRRREIRNHNVDLVGRWKVMKGCSCCGYNKHQSALHLNHKDPTTKHKHGSAKAYDAGWSKKRIKEELAKCEVLCANCHSVETHNQKVAAGIRR